MTGVLIKRENRNADREGRIPCKTGTDIGLVHLQAKEYQGLPMTTRGEEEARKDFSLKFSERLCQHLGFGLLATVLPNQVPLPNMQQAKRWDAKVCSREKVYSWGSQLRRQENKSQICLPEGGELGIATSEEYRVVGGARESDGGRKRWRNHLPVQVLLSYTLLPGMHVQIRGKLVWNVGKFGAVTSKGHLLNKQVYSLQTWLSHVGSIWFQPDLLCYRQRVFFFFNKLFPYLLFCKISKR